MKAVFVGPKFGNSAVRIEETGIADPGREDVLVKVVAAGLNPLDYNLINGNIVYNLKPVPHIPGSEVMGIVERDSRSFKKGQRVMVYNRVFDGTCEMCRTHREHLCTNGGIWGVVTNGGYSEYVTIPEKNAIAIPDSIDNDTAVSIPIGALTAYRALKRAGASAGKKLLVYGASGNTGIFAIQFARIMGLDVYGVSRKEWVRDRIVLLPDTTVSLIREYLKSRNILDVDTPSLLVSRRGNRFDTSTIERIIRNAARSAGIQKKVTPHVLRHTFATAILRNGGDIRFIQQLLGHASLNTTEIYTHIDESALKEMYEKHRPRY